jgi:signal peptidase
VAKANRSLASALNKSITFFRRNELLKTAAVLALIVVAEYAVFFGLRVAFRTEYLPFHPVSSESMVPTLNVGDLIIVKGSDPNLVTVGTIIVFHSPRNHEMLIVHRVVGITSQGGKLYFETKGDNNPTRDGWYPYPGVPEENLVGVVIGKVAYVGYVILALKEPMGMAVIVLLTGLVVIYEFILPAVRRSSKSRPHDLPSDPNQT